MIYLECTNPNGWQTGKRFACNKPSLVVMKDGLGGDRRDNWVFMDDGVPMIAQTTNKPKYQIMSMKEVQRQSPNGYSVASTFAGCGGSCLGYRMAGFKVVWANEIDHDATAIYNLNHANHVDNRDIRDIQAKDILETIGCDQNELDVLDGSPPCQTFSTAGKRNIKDKWSDLFVEYLRLIEGLKPKVFIAENVGGMAQGIAKGVFKSTLKKMHELKYRVSCRLLDAQWLGVPQVRNRLIFIGVREDLGIDPVHPKPLRCRYSVIDALPWIVRSEYDSKGFCFAANIEHKACPAVVAAQSGSIFVEGNEFERRKIQINELKRLCGFPDDFQMVGSYSQQWGKLGNAVPPVMMMHIAKTVQTQILDIIK